MSMSATIEEKLCAAFAPARLRVEDQSHLHEGHAGARPGGETHFHVEITAGAFTGQSRLARQRAVHSVLRDELAGRVHALSITARAPDEAGPGKSVP